MPPSSPSLMVWLAVFDTVYLSSALVIFSIPILWPEISVTKVFTHLITVLLPTAHIGLNGEIIRVKLNNNKFMIILPENKFKKQFVHGSCQPLTSKIEGSILLTVSLALERYITVCFPFFKHRHKYKKIFAAC